MRIIIAINGRQIQIRLEGRVIEWEDQNDLSEKLLLAIDRLIVQAGVTLSELDDIEVKSNLPDGYTSRRIAEAIAETLKFARNN